LVQKMKVVVQIIQVEPSLSFVTSQTEDSWAMDAAKASKCMRGGYEKVRPVSQKAGIRRPVP
jgi:hypothetical protein